MNIISFYKKSWLIWISLMNVQIFAAKKVKKKKSKEILLFFLTMIKTIVLIKFLLILKNHIMSAIN